MMAERNKQDVAWFSPPKEEVQKVEQKKINSS
jgi:hypothetical protein